MLALLALAAPLPALAVDPPKGLDDLATRALESRRIPGMALVVLRGDETLHARGYGVLDIERSEPIGASTVFQLGSIGKQFLAAMVLALAEDGRLSLDDTVARHLPDFSHLPKTLRLRHLLNHTSGLREQFTLPEAKAGYADLDRPVAELRAALRKAPRDFAPGARWSYSNSNYTLLAFVVEAATGVPYHEALARRFFRPLGLTSMRHCTSIPGAGEARGHHVRKAGIVHSAPENMNWAWGDGGLCGNATDLAKWTRLLSTGRVIGAESYRIMTARTPLPSGRSADYGFGLSLVTLDGTPKVAHNGAMDGFSASAAYYPGAGVTVVVLTNAGNVRTEAIERAVARRVLDMPTPVLRETALTPQERKRFVGTYDIGVFDVRIADRNGVLWLESPPPGPTTALVYLGKGELASAAEPDANRVSFAENGRIRVTMGAMHWYGIRRNP